MKKFLILAAVPAALVGLGACSTYDDYGYGYGYTDYGYSDYGPRYGGDYAPTYSSGSIWYDAYYDDFYGPVYGGYWAPDGYFWYQSRIGASYVRDHDRHFRRDDFRGYKHNRYQDNRGHGRDNDQWRANDRNTYPPLFSGQNNYSGRDNERNRDRARDNNGPRANPAPPPQWNSDRGNGGRGGNGRSDDRAGRDRDRNNGGQSANPNPRPNGNGGPPLFGGQQPRANPAPPPQPQLDGAPRGDNRNNDGARNNERGRYRQGAAPPQPRANPSPPPQQPREADHDNNRDDNDRGDRARGGDRNDSGDRDRSRGNSGGGRRD